MKYPTARKLPSGSWYCRVRVHGKDISITRRTEKEAIAEAMAIKAGIKLDDKLGQSRLRAKTVSQAIDDYIAARENVLSPSTIRGYRIIQRCRFQSVQNLKICDITKEKWQRIVNDETKLCSAKTLRNAWGLLSTVIEEATDVRVKVRLPQVVVKDLPYLSYEQIQIFVEALRGQKIEIAALLALHSLRRSEILALHWSDIDLDNRIIRVNGAAVMDENNKLVYKPETKNKSSRRKLPILPPLENALKRQKFGEQSDCVVDFCPNSLWSQINKVCIQAGVPKVGVHGLRRSFASLAYHLNLSEKWTMQIGGWSDVITMRKFYTKIAENDITRQSSKMHEFFIGFSSVEAGNDDKNDDEKKNVLNYQ